MTLTVGDLYVESITNGHEAQKIALDIDTKDLAAKAIETVEVTLDGQMLRAASRFLAHPAQSQLTPHPASAHAAQGRARIAARYPAPGHRAAFRPSAAATR